MAQTIVHTAFAGAPPSEPGVTYVAPFPFLDKVKNAGDVDEITVSDLINTISFAERTDSDPTSYGSGPFFVAHYRPAASDDPSVPLYPRANMRMIPSHYIDYRYGARQTGYTVINGNRAYFEAAVYWNDRGYQSNFYAWVLEDTWTVSSSGQLQNYYILRLNDYEHVPWANRQTLEDALQWTVNRASSGYGWGSHYPVFYYPAWKTVYVQGRDERERDFSRIPFKYGEHAFYTSKAHPWASTPFNSPGHLHSGLFSAAYYAAQDKLPQVLGTTIQNIVELGKTIISFANGIDLSDIQRAVKTLNRHSLRSATQLGESAWLSYRYQFSTTVADVEELSSMIERWDALARAPGNITSYGTKSDATGTYHCAIVIDPTQVLARSWLRKLNLRPTLSGAWDMIPYSFVVDWFTNIGKILAAIDRWLDTPSFGKVECWYSYTNTYKTDSGVLTCFFRFRGGQPLLPYWSMDWSHSDRVWGYRALDTVSLLL